jgi:tetratricopeptide (TPR) repeat protein
LGIFVNGFTVEGAVAVGSGEDLDEFELFDVLGSLVDKSLVLAEPHAEAVRYRLLESTRVYALEKLDAAGERAVLADRHLRYLRERFAELWAHVDRSGRSTELNEALQTELEDVRAALDGALARSDVTEGGKLLADIAASWRAIGIDPEGIARCERYLAALPAGESRLLARLSTPLSLSLGESGRKVRALEVATEAVGHARASGDLATLAQALRVFALAATRVDRLDEAEAALTEAEAIPGTSANLRLSLLTARAVLSTFRGDYETAALTYEQLRKEHRSLGNARGEVSAACNLAEVEHARGRTPRAIALVREVLPAARSSADTTFLATLFGNLAGYLAAVDDLSGTVAAAREAIAIYASREPDHADIAIGIEHVALVFALRGDRARAATLEGYADAALARHGYGREFTEKTTHDRLTALLREGIPPGDLARLSAEGAALAPEAALALALEPSANHRGQT